jgi:tetratricopeptide (TPR) repeat protein
VRDADLAGPATTPWTGSEPRLPEYEIVRELGRGGMGVVYLARERALNRPVALKMILAGDHAGPGDLDRFRAEAEAVARLQHPNIVQIYAVGQWGGRPYLALEYCAGGSLEDRLNGTPLPPLQAAALVETLARAMQHAHECGVIHRDLKPANILLAGCGLAPGGNPSAADWVLKIADFGLARQLDRPRGPTCSRTVLGTPSYMAPEQALRRGRAPDARADVYALGAILYELVTGRPPFAAETVLDTLHQVARDEPVPPARLQPRCPRDLETIILKCLRKDPRLRYPSALALAEDCAAVRRGEPIKARPTPGWERAVKWARRRPAAATLVAATCLAAAALLGVVLWHTAELRSAVRRARAQERAAVEEAQRVQSRAAAQDLLLQAQAAFAREAWEDARLQTDQALAALGARPDLDDLAARAERLRDECRRRLEERAAREDLQRRCETFRAQRDEALFHASLFTGLDAGTNRERARSAARAALAQFGMDEDAPEGSAATSLPADGPQRAEVVAGSYELLLVLAEATAHPAPDDSADARRRRLVDAVRIVQGTARLGLPPTPAYHLHLARYLEQLGSKGEADEHRARAATLEPASAADYFLLGQEHRRQGELARAALDFESALRLRADHFWAQYGLAVCRLREQRLGEAKAGLTACLGRRPDFAWLYALRGFVHGELHEFQAADADFRQALALGPDDITRYAVHANRGVLRFQQAQTAEPLASLQPLGPWLPPGCAVYGGVGQAYRQEKWAEAEEDLCTAVRLRPDSYQAHLSLAQVYARQGRLPAAREEFDRAVSLGRQVPDAYRSRAELARQCGDAAAARRDLLRAAELDAGTVRAAEDHVEVGRLWQREGKYEKTVAACDAALTVVPEHAGALRLRAVALLELHRYPEAAASFDRYLGRVEPGARAPALAEAYRLRGLTRTQLGLHAGAVQDYTRALEIQPDAATHTYRGWVYLVEGAPKLALDDFEAAVRLGAGDGDAYNGRGNARAKLGQGREAVRDAEEALRRGPRTPRMLHNSATVYAQAAGLAAGAADRHGDEERALDLLREAVAAVAADRRARFWAEQIDRDPDLAPLRGLSRYRELAPRP